MYIKLLAPQMEQDNAQEGISRVEGFNKSSKIKLNKDEYNRLKQHIEDYYDEWDRSTSSFRNRLIELNEILEGEEEDTDFPFGVEDSSQINLRLASAYFRSFRTIFRRGIFDNPNLFVAKSKNPSEDNIKLPKQEKALYWFAMEDTNLLSTLKDTDLPCYRDGMALVHGQWVRQMEKGVDYKVYNTFEDFVSDYPSDESAGIKEEKYTEIMDLLQQPQEENKEPEEVVVEYDIDFVKKDGAEFKLFPLANFIFYPYFVDSIKDLQMYGFLYKETIQDLRIKIKSGFYDKNAEKLIKSDKDNEYVNSYMQDFWDKSRERVEGIESDKEDVIEIARLNVKFDLDEDKIPEKYTIYWHPIKKEIIRCEKYKIRLNIPDIVGFKIIARDGRFLGVSLLDEVSDLIGEINAIHRHRSNVRRLTDSPIPMMPKSIKDNVDFWKLKPGFTLWLPDEMLANNSYPRQFQLYNVDQTRTSIDEETKLQSDIETLLGPTQGLSGQIDPSDPRAPGNKTAMLLHQANARIQDYIDEWKRSIPDILDLLIALYYQNSKSKLNFVYSENGNENVSDIDIRDFIGNNTKFHLTANTTAISPELEMSRIAAVMQSAVQFGIQQINPQILIDGWNAYVAASRVPMFEKFLIQAPQQQQPQQQQIPGQTNNQQITQSTGGIEGGLQQ